LKLNLIGKRKLRKLYLINKFIIKYFFLSFFFTMFLCVVCCVLCVVCCVLCVVCCETPILHTPTDLGGLAIGGPHGLFVTFNFFYYICFSNIERVVDLLLLQSWILVPMFPLCILSTLPNTPKTLPSQHDL
jgi:hypothetical protein